MHSVPILHRHCRSKTNFYVFSYDKISLKFCASFRFFLAVFMEKFPKIRYLSYVRRGITIIDELTVQVWLLYHHPNFKYCTLTVSGTELRTDKPTDRQTDGRSDY